MDGLPEEIPNRVEKEVPPALRPSPRRRPPPPPPQSRWWRPPKLRTLQHGGTERRASWLELFFDLVLVVAIAQLAHVYVHHPGINAAWAAGGLFCTVFLAWQGFMAYADRFDTDDLPFRLATFVQMLLLMVLALQIPEVAEAHVATFALAFAAYRAILVAEYVRAWQHAAVARPLVARYAGVYAVSVLLWGVSSLLRVETAVPLWAIAVLIDLLVPLVSTRLHEKIPTDPAHLPERFGLFTLIVIGELVVSVGAGSRETAWSGIRIAVAVAGFVVAVALWWLYFERLNGRELPRRAGPIVVFAYAHLPLLAALMFVAAGVAVLVSGPENAAGGRWALAAGSAVCVGAMTLAQRQLGVVFEPRVAGARGAVALLLLAAGALPGSLPPALACAVLLIVLVVVESVLCGPPPPAKH